MKICVVGLGTVGEPVARYINKLGFDVCGYDLKKKTLGDITTFTSMESIPLVDVYVVAVPSNNVETVCRKIAEINRECLVSIESTVPVGTCRGLSKTLGLDVLVHCPHRYWVEEPVEHGVRQLRVIGGVNERSLKQGLAFYRKLDIPLHVCSTVEVAELCKIAENAYRFVQIAFAEELWMISEKHKISFDEVRNACNTKWNIEIPEARDGIYGSCLPQDMGFLRLLSNETPLLEGAVLADRNYKAHLRPEKTESGD